MKRATAALLLAAACSFDGLAEGSDGGTTGGTEGATTLDIPPLSVTTASDTTPPVTSTSGTTTGDTSGDAADESSSSSGDPVTDETTSTGESSSSTASVDVCAVWADGCAGPDNYDDFITACENTLSMHVGACLQAYRDWYECRGAEPDCTTMPGGPCEPFANAVAEECL